MNTNHQIHRLHCDNCKKVYKDPTTGEDSFMHSHEVNNKAFADKWHIDHFIELCNECSEKAIIVRLRWAVTKIDERYEYEYYTTKTMTLEDANKRIFGFVLDRLGARKKECDGNFIHNTKSIVAEVKVEETVILK